MTVATESVEQVSAEENFGSLMSQMEEKNNPTAGDPETESSENVEPVGGQSEADSGAPPSPEEGEAEPVKPKNLCSFKKGEETWNMPDDAEFTFKADGEDVTKTLAELRDTAAGDVAIRTRMRELAEQKKDLHKPIKKFISLSKSDPLQALKIIAEQAKQIDEEFTYEAFIQALAQQGRSLSSMSEEEKKAHNLQRELEQLKEENQSKTKEVDERIRRKEFLEKTRLSEEDCNYMGEQILNNESLSKDIESQEDLDNMIEHLNNEVMLKKKAFKIWKEVNPEIVDQDIQSPLVTEITRQMRQNPDFTDGDLKDIINDVELGMKRKRATKTLSRKRKVGMTHSENNRQNNGNLQTLLEQIEKKRNKN